MKGKVCISRRAHMKGDGVVSINIADASSRQVIVEVEMSLSEFAEALTGMSECESEIVHVITPESASRVGLTCVTEWVTVELPDNEHRLPKDTPDQFFSKYIPDGYVLHSNCLSTKQPIGKHIFTIRKWVDGSDRND